MSPAFSRPSTLIRIIKIESQEFVHVHRGLGVAKTHHAVTGAKVERIKQASQRIPINGKSAARGRDIWRMAVALFTITLTLSFTDRTKLTYGGPVRIQSIVEVTTPHDNIEPLKEPLRRRRVVRHVHCARRQRRRCTTLRL